MFENYTTRDSRRFSKEEIKQKIVKYFKQLVHRKRWCCKLRIEFFACKTSRLDFKSLTGDDWNFSDMTSLGLNYHLDKYRPQESCSSHPNLKNLDY